jgi:iron complex outermembrane receptor protein
MTMLKSVESVLPRGALRLLLGAGALALTPFASAQTATPTQSASSDAPAELAEIIVTANKVAEPVQRVAETINVVSASTLDDMHIQSIQEIATLVGGLSLTRTSPSEQSISLRGIKMPSQGGAGGTTNTVESYLNDAPISVVDVFTTPFDLNQVEVLRGPQGTLRGRPSPSGALTLTTQRGSFSGYDGYVEATGSNHDGQNVQAAFGGPINDTLAFRIAGVYDNNDGTDVKDIYNGRHNYATVGAGRVTLTWRPIDRLEFNIMEQYTHDDRDFYRQVEGTAPCAGGQGGAILVSSIACGQTLTLQDKIALNQGTNLNFYRGSLTTLNGRYELSDHLELDYVGSYNHTNYFSDLDFDFAGIGDANEFAKDIAVTARAHVVTNELRLQSLDYDFYNFTYGIFTANNTTDTYTSFPPLFTSDARSNTKDFGIFTNQRFALTEHDNLSLGLRYSRITVDALTAGLSNTYQATTGNASYQHQFTQDVMAYASYGTSFRPGSGEANASPQAAIPASYGNFGDEHSKTYEVGFKAQWFDRRLTTDLSLFDQIYNGYIASQFNIACTGVPNPNGLAYATTDGTPNGPQCFGTMFANANAISRGIEAEVRALPTPDWMLDLIYTYTDAHFANALVPCNDYDGSGSPNVNGTPRVVGGSYVSECHSNTTLGSLPKTSVSLITNYNFHFGGLEEYIRGNVNTHDKSYFPQTAVWFPGYTLVNLTVGVSANDHKWDVNLWAKNLFNKVVQDTDGGPWTIYGVPSGLRIGTVTNDREVGGTVRYNF